MLIFNVYILTVHIISFPGSRGSGPSSLENDGFSYGISMWESDGISWENDGKMFENWDDIGFNGMKGLDLFILALDFTKLYPLVGCYHHNEKYSNMIF